ncbi:MULTISPECIES: FadR/GntR family transcriptional regulator [unclassified Cryobacterium]|uniref:FadR/GntR family transcriptional regulator n=1 Tax=unclassified Cryobacterium TaxID=2649013 RepID=UPI001068E30E|nr:MULTISPECIES: FCD domain-containing protein [unclassified Cryobacterium]TFD17262.1 FadR family transcriptional regulator [Cryobacterium sp. TMT4-10]TFD25719.1 FadR family transcriptional regulator [Cryobacterium sp. TMT2-23]
MNRGAGAASWRERGLHARVLNALGQQIVDAAYAPGDILNLDQIIDDFAVSRSVLREALRVLQSLGMVEPRQRVGTQVLPREFWDLMNPQIIGWRGRGRGAEYYTQMRELLELRLGIEPVAARLSARLMTQEQLDAVQAAAAAMMESNLAGEGPRFLEADVRFHSLILIGSGNSVMAHFAGTVAAVLQTRQEEKRFTITEYTPPSAHRHNQLAEALVERDEDAAYRWSYATIEATLAEFTEESAGA